MPPQPAIEAGEHRYRWTPTQPRDVEAAVKAARPGMDGFGRIERRSETGAARRLLLNAVSPPARRAAAPTNVRTTP
jgi:hypothetical protein